MKFKKGQKIVINSRIIMINNFIGTVKDYDSVNKIINIEEHTMCFYLEECRHLNNKPNYIK